jgi:NitT/TauT family transport system permease protein
LYRRLLRNGVRRAWNISIVAEYSRFRGQTFSINGLGAVISRATDTFNLPLLLGPTIATSALAISVNRLVWRLYDLASTKFKLELILPKQRGSDGTDRWLS